MYNRDAINGMAGKAAALPKFSDTLTLSQPEGGRLCPPIGFASPKYFRNYAPEDSSILKNLANHEISETFEL